MRIFTTESDTAISLVGEGEQYEDACALLRLVDGVSAMKIDQIIVVVSHVKLQLGQRGCNVTLVGGMHG